MNAFNQLLTSHFVCKIMQFRLTWCNLEWEQKCSDSVIRALDNNKLQQLVEATHHIDKSLCVYWRIIVKIFVSVTEFCRISMSEKIKSYRICLTCYGNKILLQHMKGFVTVMCHCNVILQWVAWHVHMKWSVAATCHLVCSDLQTFRPKYCAVCK